jgi:hypothetical protein
LKTQLKKFEEKEKLNFIVLQNKKKMSQQLECN